MIKEIIRRWLWVLDIDEARLIFVEMSRSVDRGLGRIEELERAIRILEIRVKELEQ